MKRLRADRESIEEAVAVLRAGGVVAYPTDTLYGLAVDPRSNTAVERLFAVKGRERTQAIPLIAGDIAQARLAGRFTAEALRLARASWPGPVSIVVDAQPALSRALVNEDGTVAIRVPAQRYARDLAQAFGFCITSTSANLSGEPATASPDAVAVALADRIDLLLDAGTAPGGSPSTIVAFRDGAPVLVRAGAIAWERVLEFLE